MYFAVCHEEFDVIGRIKQPLEWWMESPEKTSTRTPPLLSTSCGKLPLEPSGTRNFRTSKSPRPPQSLYLAQTPELQDAACRKTLQMHPAASSFSLAELVTRQQLQNPLGAVHFGPNSKRYHQRSMYSSFCLAYSTFCLLAGWGNNILRFKNRSQKLCNEYSQVALSADLRCVHNCETDKALSVARISKTKFQQGPACEQKLWAKNQNLTSHQEKHCIPPKFNTHIWPVKALDPGWTRKRAE